VASRLIGAVRRSAALAALLSFILPGLGQGWVGKRLRAALFVVPMILLVAVSLLIVVTQGKARTAGLLIQPQILLGLLALNLGILLYRVVAIVDAYRLARSRWPGATTGAARWVAAGLLVVILGGTLGMHAVVGYDTYSTYDTIQTVFHTTEPATPTPVPQGLAPGATPRQVPTPVPRWTADGRLNVLLIGGDAGPGRWSLRTDTMELLSIEISTGRAALFGIPRNLVNAPLPPGPAGAFECRCYPDLLNSLFVYATEHPEWFPGSDEERGYRAVQDAVERMVGVQIDGQVVVTLNGFVRLVDAFGGIDISTPVSVFDSEYPEPDGTGNVQLWIPAGQHHFDGYTALAYTRSRHQDNDYNRMDRQQLVLLALRQQINPCSVIARIPELLDIAKDALWTNLPLSEMPDLLELGARTNLGSIARYQFWPPDINEDLDEESLTLIHQMVANPFLPIPALARAASEVALAPPVATPAPAPGDGGPC